MCVRVYISDIHVQYSLPILASTQKGTARRRARAPLLSKGTNEPHPRTPPPNPRQADLDLRGPHGHEALLDDYDVMDEDRAAYGAYGGLAPNPGGGGGGSGGPGASGSGGAGRPKRVRGKRGWQEGAP